jgi:transcriptional antiterminator RfaH
MEKQAWFAVQTKPRQEQIAAEHLARQGFECYLPKAWNPSQRVPSKKPRIEPLFPRYLFVQANTGSQNISAVNYTRGVSKLVKFGNCLIQVPEWVITGLVRATDAVSGLVEVENPRLNLGDQVEVFEGPFAGLKGVFQATDGPTRAVLLLSLLGRENTVNVACSSLRMAR